MTEVTGTHSIYNNNNYNIELLSLSIYNCF